MGLIRVAGPTGRGWSLVGSANGKRTERSRGTEFVPGKGGSRSRGSASFENYLFADFQRKFPALKWVPRFLPNPSSLSPHLAVI